MKAWELLSDRGKWTSGALARTVTGDRVDPYNKSAVRFCALGAIAHCYQNRVNSKNCKDGVSYQERAAANVAWRLYETESLVFVNDTLGYDATLRVLKEADV